MMIGNIMSEPKTIKALKKNIFEALTILKCDEVNWLMPDKVFLSAVERVQSEAEYKAGIIKQWPQMESLQKAVELITEENLLSSQNPTIATLAHEFSEGFERLKKEIGDGTEA